MKKPSPKPPAPRPNPLPSIFAGVFGAFIGITLMKFGNPPIMEKWVNAPANIFEFLVVSPWPLRWAYGCLAITALLGLAVVRLKPRPPAWLLLLPLVWFVWQIAAEITSVNPELTALTLWHFGACLVCFYLGIFALSRSNDLWPFFIGILCGLVLVFAIGFDQHFGALEESRKFFYHQLELYPREKENYPPEFLRKIASNRIYSTLFYPNTLAGVVLLFLPVMLVVLPGLSDRLHDSRSRVPTISALIGTAAACLLLYVMSSRAGWLLVILIGLAIVLPVPKWTASGLLALAAAACLFWSGSKGGWLLLLFLGLLALLRLPLGKQIKIALVTIILVGGLAGFFVKYASFFRKGATSVVARFDYWRAAVETTKTHAWFGTGPGTFAVPYEQIKHPDSEMARLVHNDYLEQGSDSGIPGLITYAALIVGGLVWTFRRTVLAADSREARVTFALWLGLLGWSLQCFFEFSLYIPALAWPAFAFLGLLLGRGAAVQQPLESVRQPVPSRLSSRSA